MADPARGALPAKNLRATLAGDGRPGPIEERIGRRLVRLVDPESIEGTELLRSGFVEILAPGGEILGRMSVDEALERLIRRLEAHLVDGDATRGDRDLLDGLARLRARRESLGAH